MAEKLKLKYRFFHTAVDSKEGRQIFEKVITFCERFESSILIYLPVSDKFLIYFDYDVVQVNLGQKHIRSKNFKTILEGLVKESGLFYKFFTPKFFTSKTLPEVHLKFDFMSAPIPRKKINNKFGLAFIGSLVTRLMKSATFPLFIPAENKTNWKRIVVFYGGNKNKEKALNFAFFLHNAKRQHKMPIHTITLKTNKKDVIDYEKMVKKNLELLTPHLYEESEDYRNIVQDSLIIAGANARSMFFEIFKGHNKLDFILNNFDEDIFIVGKNYKELI